MKWKLLTSLALGIFMACNNNPQQITPKETQNTPQLTTEDYSKMGLDYAMTTKGQLGKNLIGRITNEGTASALSFCSVNALSLTDSMAKVQKVHIKRVSDKNRNPKNQANAQELKYIEQFKQKIAQQEEWKPIVIESKDSVQFYSPIISNALCLQCHGKVNEDIKPSVLAQIQDLYPEDKAIGYKPNQVRGIWSVRFTK